MTFSLLENPSTTRKKWIHWPCHTIFECLRACASVLFSKRIIKYVNVVRSFQILCRYFGVFQMVYHFLLLLYAICLYVCTIACLWLRNWTYFMASSTVVGRPCYKICWTVTWRELWNNILDNALTSSSASCALNSSLKRPAYNVPNLLFGKLLRSAGLHDRSCFIRTKLSAKIIPMTLVLQKTLKV